MKVCVLGAGSVGLGVAATFIKAGAQVALSARGGSLRALQAEGIHVTGVLGEHVIAARDFSAVDAGHPETALSSCDVVVVATKTYEVAPALKVLAPFLKANAKLPAVLLLQNGWGSAEEAKQILPAGTPLFSGSVMIGFERVAPAQVRVNVYGDGVRAGSLFGDDIENIRPLFDLAKRGFIDFALESSIEPILLGKLLYNICLNPLGAILRCTYGELLENETTLGLMERIAGEAIRTLAAARGFSRFADGKSYIRGELVPKWAAKVAAHRSSMLQDIEAGRRTEIHYLNGAVAAMGREFGVATPGNDIMVELVLGAESIRAKRRG